MCDDGEGKSRSAKGRQTIIFGETNRFLPIEGEEKEKKWCSDQTKNKTKKGRKKRE